MNTNFKVIDLTRLEIKRKSTAQETDALATRPSELFKKVRFSQKNRYGALDIVSSACLPVPWQHKIVNIIIYPKSEVYRLTYR